MQTIVLRMLLASAAFFAPEENNRLQLLRAAHEANQGRYPEGELRVRYREGQIGKHTEHHYSECRLLWSEDKIWTAAENWDIEDRRSIPKGPSVLREEWIVEARRSILYVPHSAEVNILSNTESKPPVRARLTPDGCWYGRWGGEGFPWLVMLEPQLITKVDNSKISYSTRDLADGYVEVVREDAHLGTQLTMVCSLVMDGNVCTYQLMFPDAGYTIEGKCEWARDEQGRCYLSRRVEEMVVETSDGRVRSYKEYETLYFNADRHVESGRFEINSLRLPRGATIRDSIGGKLSRVGDRQINGVVSKLGALSDLMKMRGFGATVRGN